MASIAVAIGFLVAGGMEINLAIVFAAIAAFLITGAGNTINDYYDRETDKKNAPKRPIPSGAISADSAFLLAILLFVIGIVMSYFINEACLALASFNSVVLFLYGRNLKSSVLVGNVAVSYLTASTFVYGALVLNNPVTTMFLALLAFLANVGREIIGDVEDMKGDKKAGLRTYALVHGSKKSWMFGRVYILAAILLSPLPYLIGLLGFYYLIPVLIADAIFLASIATNDARRNQKLTKIAIFVGLLAFLIGALL